MNEDIFRIFISMRPWECAFFSPFRISPGCREPPLGCQEWPVWNRKVVLTRILSAVRTMTEAGTPRTSTISSLASKLRRGNQIQIPGTYDKSDTANGLPSSTDPSIQAAQYDRLAQRISTTTLRHVSAGSLANSESPGLYTHYI